MGKKTAASSAATTSEVGTTTYMPKSAFGRELMAIRATIVALGQPLLSWEELEREIADRRGGVVDDER